MARLLPRTNKSRMKRDLVQKQNLNAPGGIAEWSARMHDAQDDRGFTGSSGPDRRLKPWNWGLGYETLADPQLTVQMTAAPDNALPPKPGRGKWLKPRGKGASDGIT